MWWRWTIADEKYIWNTLISRRASERDRQTDRQAGRQTGRQADRRTDGRTDGQTDRQTDGQTDSQTDRQRRKQRDRENSNSKTLFYKDYCLLSYWWIIVKYKRERQTDRQTDRDRDRETETDRQTDRQTYVIPCRLVNWAVLCCQIRFQLLRWLSISLPPYLYSPLRHFSSGLNYDVTRWSTRSVWSNCDLDWKQRTLR